MSDPLLVVVVLCVNILVAEWLVRHTFVGHMGTALLVIVLTALCANLGVIPSSPSATPAFDAIFDFVAPFAIFLPLLEVNLRDLRKAGLPMIASFAIGAGGTFVAVPLAMWIIGGQESIGPSYAALGGMFVGTYTGGSVNFNALALHYGVAKEGLLYAGSTAVDNIITAVWMVVTLALPRALGGGGFRRSATPNGGGEMPDDGAELDPPTLALLIGMGVAALWVSNGIADSLSRRGVSVPSILILTTIALILAQFPAVGRLKGSRPLGMFAVYLFLAVVGAFCDLGALARIGSFGITLFLLAAITVAVHGLIGFVAGRLCSKDWGVLAVASQANIGGATSALALARSLGRSDLVLPAVLVGSLGYGIGTYLGFIMAAYVLS
ncbi:MAG: DUF819 domain-containing protein [Acidobacteriota bacterium]